MFAKKGAKPPLANPGKAHQDKLAKVQKATAKAKGK